MQRDVTLYIWYAAILLVTIAVQVVIVPLVSVAEAVPDLIVIFLVYIALRRGQLTAMLYGFAGGFLYDLFAGDVVGISALANTIAVFAAGFFFSPEREEQRLYSPVFVGVTALAAALHNCVFILVYFQNAVFTTADVLLRHGAGASLFTAVLSVIPVLILSRTRKRVKVSI